MEPRALCLQCGNGRFAVKGWEAINYNPPPLLCFNPPPRGGNFIRPPLLYTTLTPAIFWGGGGELGLRKIFSAAPPQSEICVKFSVFHTVFDVKFW